MYFKDKEHNKNYRKLITLFPKVALCSRNRSVAYVSALPEVFDTIYPIIHNYETPVAWMLDWVKMKESVDKGLIHPSFLPFELTEKTEQLGNLALHLWNSDYSFNLMNCFQVLDQGTYRCVFKAIAIRFQIEDIPMNA